MDLSRFYSRYNTFMTQIRIPQVMAQHGLALLQRCIYLQHCDETNLRLLPDVVHLEPRQRQCENMVYFLLKNTDGLVEYRALDNNVRVLGNTLVYAGQTGNLARREAGRSGIMRNSTMILCFGHNLSPYQQDCLELASIAFAFLVFGLRTKNVSPYPKLVYRNVPADISIHRIEGHAELQGTSTYGLLRRVMFVGTAPTIRIMNLQWYTDLLQNATNPELPWDLLASTSPSLSRLLSFLTSGDGTIEPPPFIDHFPDFSSEKYDDLSVILTGSMQRTYDRQVHETARRMNSQIMVMFGGRPTQLIDTVHRNRFLSSICSRVDLNYISRQTCNFIMWWPHFGIETHASEAAKVRLSHVWLLLSLKLYLLLWRLDSEPFDENGLDQQRARSILQWLANLPLSNQLSELLLNVSVNWMSTDIGTSAEFMELATETTVSTTATESVTDPISCGMIIAQDQESIEAEATTSAAIVLQPDTIVVTQETTEETVVDEIVETVTLQEGAEDHLEAHFQGWAPWTETQMINRTMQRVPHFLVLTRDEQVQELTLTARNWSTSFRDGRLQRAVERGDFVPLEGEEHDTQRVRFQREYNMARVRRSHRPDADRLTCVFCNEVIHKVVTASGKVHVPTHPAHCPNTPSMKIGWAVVRGAYDDIFPDQNLFVLFSRAQEPGTILDHMQLARDVAVYCNDNDWHPQVRDLTDVRYYPSWRRVIQAYVAGEDPGAVKGGWIKAIKEVMRKVARTEAITIVERQKTRAEGFRASRSESTNTMTIYTFQLASAPREQPLRQEQQ